MGWWEGTKPLAFATAEKKNLDIYEFVWVIFSNTGKEQTEDLDFQGGYILPITSYLILMTLSGGIIVDCDVCPAYCICKCN